MCPFDNLQKITENLFFDEESKCDFFLSLVTQLMKLKVNVALVRGSFDKIFKADTVKTLNSE